MPAHVAIRRGSGNGGMGGSVNTLREVRTPRSGAPFSVFPPSCSTEEQLGNMLTVPYRRVIPSCDGILQAAAHMHIDTQGQSDAQMEAELAEYESHTAQGTSHLEQQLKEGLFTKVRCVAPGKSS